MRAEQIVPRLPPQLPALLRRHHAHGLVEREDAALPVEQRQGVRGGHGLTLPGELSDASDCTLQRRLVEEVRSRVRDVAVRPVQLVAAYRRIDAGTQRDL